MGIVLFKLNMKFFWDFLSCVFSSCQVTEGTGERVVLSSTFLLSSGKRSSKQSAFSFVIFKNNMKMLQILQPGLLKYPQGMTLIQSPSWPFHLLSWPFHLFVVGILWFLLPSTWRTLKGWHNLIKNHNTRKSIHKENCVWAFSTFLSLFH